MTGRWRIFNRAIELDPNDALAYFNRGNAYADQEEYARAMEDFNRAIELDPNDALAYYNRGVTYADQGEYDRAMEDCNRAIEINPEHARFYLLRGSLLRRLGAVPEMLIDFDNAVRLCSNYESDFLDRKLLSNEDVVGQAIETLRAVADDPGDSRVCRRLLLGSPEALHESIRGC